MKTGRRHELKENDLAHMLEAAQTYLTQRGGRILFTVGAVVVVIAIVSISVRSRAAALEDAWQRKQSLAFEDAEEGKRSLETLDALTKDAADPAFVLTSLIDLGTHALRLAHEVDVPPDPELNEMARNAFTRLLARLGDNPMAFGVAHCGLATVEENAFVLDGNLAHKERARQHLEAVTGNPAVQGLPFHRLALDRQKLLDNVFTVVRFEAAPVEEETTEGEPVPITPTRVSPEDVPQRILQKVKVQPDGSMKVLETRQEPAP